MSIDELRADANRNVRDSIAQAAAGDQQTKRGPGRPRKKTTDAAPAAAEPSGPPAEVPAALIKTIADAVCARAELPPLADAEVDAQTVALNAYLASRNVQMTPGMTLLAVTAAIWVPRAVVALERRARAAERLADAAEKRTGDDVSGDAAATGEGRR